jgi:transposase
VKRAVRRPLDLDRRAIVRDRQAGMSLGKIAKVHGISRATVFNVLQQEMPASDTVQKGCQNQAAVGTKGHRSAEP